MSPRRLYAALALAEAVTWALLLGGMVLKYVTRTTELGVRIGGGLHGFVFLAFVAATVVVAVDARWSLGRLLVSLAGAVVPFASVPVERSAARAGGLPKRWRLREEAPRGAVERLVGAGLRAPVPAAVVVLVVLGVVFAGLLAAGPPTQWSAG